MSVEPLQKQELLIIRLGDGQKSEEVAPETEDHPEMVVVVVIVGNVIHIKDDLEVSHTTGTVTVIVTMIEGV